MVSFWCRFLISTIRLAFLFLQLFQLAWNSECLAEWFKSFKSLRWCAREKIIHYYYYIGIAQWYILRANASLLGLLLLLCCCQQVKVNLGGGCPSEEYYKYMNMHVRWWNWSGKGRLRGVWWNACGFFCG